MTFLKVFIYYIPIDPSDDRKEYAKPATRETAPRLKGLSGNGVQKVVRELAHNAVGGR